MQMNDNSEPKRFLSELYTKVNDNKEIDEDGYSKDLILRTYNLLDKNYSLTYLFGRLKDDAKVVATIDGLDEADDIQEKINWLAKGMTYSLY